MASCTAISITALHIAMVNRRTNKRTVRSSDSQCIRYRFGCGESADSLIGSARIQQSSTRGPAPARPRAQMKCSASRALVALVLVSFVSTVRSNLSGFCVAVKKTAVCSANSVPVTFFFASCASSTLALPDNRLRACPSCHALYQHDWPSLSLARNSLRVTAPSAAKLF